MVLSRKRKKKRFEDAIYKTMILVTWDKEKDNKEKNIQRNKRNCRKGHKRVEAILRAFQRLQTGNLPAQNEKRVGLSWEP
jgi:hypothetical protein